ncbi:MAG TPA: hypothetical protein VFD30_12600 [Terriglobia bacterium]|nr:hypothetical protein [Terriglobia bacterium]
MWPAIRIHHPTSFKEGRASNELVVIPPHPVDWERFVTRAREGVGLQFFDYRFIFHTGDRKGANVVRRGLEASHPILVAYPTSPLTPAKDASGRKELFLHLSC